MNLYMAVVYNTSHRFFPSAPREVTIIHKTCIRCFELSDGADMMNIPGEAGTGILGLFQTT